MLGKAFDDAAPELMGRNASRVQRRFRSLPVRPRASGEAAPQANCPGVPFRRSRAHPCGSSEEIVVYREEVSGFRIDKIDVLGARRA